jgi:transposase
MTALADVVRRFAQLTADRRGAKLDTWIAHVRNAELVELEPFLVGLEQDHDAAVAGLIEPYSNGHRGHQRQTKLIKRRMYERAGFALLRHRILLG